MEVRLTLVLAFVTMAGGCVDCFDGAELEAAHREGEVEALAINHVEYGRGYDRGSLLTYDDGLADGDRDGYADGHYDGYYSELGYPRGYDDGFVEGQHEGLFNPNACTSGADQGWVDGENNGYNTGWDEGHGLGWDDGYADGLADGSASCELALARLERDEAQICHERGYDRRLDRGAFDRGYADGKRDNVDYQAGYSEQYDLS
jgi:hypothetical protein